MSAAFAADYAVEVLADAEALEERDGEFDGFVGDAGHRYGGGL